MRGDRPVFSDFWGRVLGFTPHARGSTFRAGDLQTRLQVYPACAGIDPARSTACRQGLRLPRMRGDRPALAETFKECG